MGWSAPEKGSRRDAGFSIIQSDRVITVGRQSYRPETKFGEQEGGSNLTGKNDVCLAKFFLEGIAVIHKRIKSLSDDANRKSLNPIKTAWWYETLSLDYRKGVDDIQDFDVRGKRTPLGDPAPNVPSWLRP